MPSSEGGNLFSGFTHKGKALEEFDDFNEQISQSSDGEEYDENGMDQDQNQKGNLNQEMVKKLNFGGWNDTHPRKQGNAQEEEEEVKSKSRKEVFEEIMAKSKAYKMAKSEMKMANDEVRQ